MWSAELISNRDQMLSRVEYLKKLPLHDPGTYLHLGCGPQIIPLFDNVDKYYQHPQVQNYDMYLLPHESGSVKAIYSSHSLEHLPFRHARLALKEWARVLSDNGCLYLAVPDMELCFQAMMNPSVSFYNKWHWFVYTIWGFQVDPNSGQNPDLNLPVDPGQFHQCGFSKEFLQVELESVGLQIRNIFSYDGWDTPSIFVEAIKGATLV